MFGHLVVDRDDDLALVYGLVGSLHVLDLERVSRAGSVVTHAGNQDAPFRLVRLCNDI